MHWCNARGPWLGRCSPSSTKLFAKRTIAFATNHGPRPNGVCPHARLPGHQGPRVWLATAKNTQLDLAVESLRTFDSQNKLRLRRETYSEVNVDRPAARDRKS